MWNVLKSHKGEREASVANSTICDPDWRDGDRKGGLILKYQFLEEAKKKNR